MNSSTQIIALVLGGLFAIAGIILFAKKGSHGKNTIKLLGTEFQLAGSSLVIFVLGCLLIFAALKINLATGTQEALTTDKTNQPPVVVAPSPPPEFVTKLVYWTNNIERTEFNVEPGMLPPEKTDDFLRLDRLAFGTANRTNTAFQVDYVIKNTSLQPIFLDLNERFFSMVDDLGNTAELLYFCCASKGELLSPGQERTVQLIFKNVGWHGKNLSAKWIFLRVNGFSPVIGATWKLRTLATAN